MSSTYWSDRFREAEAEQARHQVWLERCRAFADANNHPRRVAARAARLLTVFPDAEMASERDLLRFPGCGRYTAQFIREMVGAA